MTASLSGSCFDVLSVKESATLITFYLWHMAVAPCLQRRQCLWFEDKIKMEASISSCLWICPDRKKILPSFSRFMAEPTRYIWILLWRWLQRAPSTCEGKNTHIKQCIASHTHTPADDFWELADYYVFYTFILSFRSKDALAGRCQQHDRQVRCQGSPGLYPHLHTSAAQHIVS